MFCCILNDIASAKVLYCRADKRFFSINKPNISYLTPVFKKVGSTQFSTKWLDYVADTIREANRVKHNKRNIDIKEATSLIDKGLIKTFNTVQMTQQESMLKWASELIHGKGNKFSSKYSKYSEKDMEIVQKFTRKFRKEQKAKMKRGLEMDVTLNEYIQSSMTSKKSTRLTKAMFLTDTRFTIKFGAEYFSFNPTSLIFTLRELFLSIADEDKHILYTALSKLHYGLPLELEKALRYVFSNAGFNNLPGWLGGKASSNDAFNKSVQYRERMQKELTRRQKKRRKGNQHQFDQLSNKKIREQRSRDFDRSKRDRKKKKDVYVPKLNKFAVRSLVKDLALKNFFLNKLSDKPSKGFGKKKLERFEDIWSQAKLDPSILMEHSDYQRIRSWGKDLMDLPEATAQLNVGESFWVYLLKVAATLTGVGAMCALTFNKLKEYIFEKIDTTSQMVKDRAVDIIYAGVSIFLFLRTEMSNKPLVLSMIAMYFAKDNIQSFCVKFMDRFSSSNKNGGRPRAQATGADINVFTSLYNLMLDTIGIKMPVEILKLSTQKVKNFSTLVHGLVGVDKLVKFLIKVVNNCKSYLSYYISYTGNEAYQERAEAWKEKASKLYGLRDSTKTMTFADASAVVSLYNEGSELLADMTKANTLEMVVASFTMMLGKLDGAYSRAMSTLQSGKPRKQPLCIGLYGDAGVGKSKFVDILIRHMHEVDRKINPDLPKFDEINLVYNKNPGEEFYDDYNFQKYVIFDDPFIVDNRNDTAKVVSEIIGCINVAPYNLRCADMNMKGTKPFMSEVVFITFNDDSNLGIKDETAYNRRYTCLFKARRLKKPSANVLIDPDCTEWDLVNVHTREVIETFNSRDMIKYVLELYSNYDNINKISSAPLARIIEEGGDIFSIKADSSIDANISTWFHESTKIYGNQGEEEEDIDLEDPMAQLNEVEEDPWDSDFWKKIEGNKVPSFSGDIIKYRFDFDQPEHFKQMLYNELSEDEYIARLKYVFEFHDGTTIKVNYHNNDSELFCRLKFTITEYDDGTKVYESKDWEATSKHWVQVNNIFTKMKKWYKEDDLIKITLLIMIEVSVWLAIGYGLRYVYRKIFAITNQGPYSGMRKSDERTAKRIPHTVRTVKPINKSKSVQKEVESQLSENAATFLNSKKNKRMFVKIHFGRDLKFTVNGIMVSPQKLITVRHGKNLIMNSDRVAISFCNEEDKIFEYDNDDVGYVESEQHDILMMTMPGTDLQCRPFIEMFIDESHIHAANFSSNLDEIYLHNGNFIANRLGNAYSAVNRKINGSNGVHYHYVIEGKSYSGKSGDCGRPLFYTSGSTIKIAGFRVAGGRNLGVYLPLFKEDILLMVNADLIPDAQGYPGDVPAERTQAVPKTTRIVESAIHGKIQEPTKAPAMLGVFERDGEIISPLKNAMKKIVSNHTRLDPQCLEAAGNAFLHKLPSHGKDFGPVSSEEAINGIIGDDRYQALNLSASPGHPFKYIKRNSKKRHWFDGEENQLHAKEGLVEEMEKIERGESTVIFTDTLKDEIQSLEKRREGRTRLFSVAPLHFVLRGRKLLMNFQAFMLDNFIKTGIPVGLNVHSCHWRLLYEELLKYPQFLNGDFKNFDQNIPYEICLLARDILMSLHSNPEEIEDFFNQIIYRVHWIGNKAYCRIGGNPSGQPFTTMFNSICNQLMIYYCFAKAYQRLFGKLPEDKHYYELYAVVYGDDNLIGVSDKISWFTMKVLASEMAEIGIVYTTPDKSEIGDLKFYSIKEVSFLKRTFFPKGGKILAPRPIEEVLETLNWVNGDLPWSQATSDNAQAVLDDLMHHGRETYELYYRKINKELTAAQCKKVFYRFDELWNDM